ncbi:MAG: hypothetical protein AAF236_01325 [Verrucomicrobiota bacterium]
MEKEDFREMLSHNLPMTIVSSSGEKYEVPHPDFVHLAPEQGTAVIVFKEKGIGFNLLDLSTISDVQLSSAERAI